MYFSRGGNEILLVQNKTLIGMVIKPKPGTYALILSCSTKIHIQIGSLRTMCLQPGYYVYLGSALGHGGLRARIAHHRKLSPKPHWHIDYLRAHTQIHGIWFSYDARRREHQWARAMLTMRGARVPLPGFGASDCNCRSHLYFFNRCPSRMTFQRGLGRRHPPGGGVLAWQVESIAHRPIPPSCGSNGPQKEYDRQG
jgi:Uri superfamily endonuclease